MFRFIAAGVLAFSCIAQVSAVEHGKFGVSAEVVSYADIFNIVTQSNLSYMPPLASIGLRYSMTEMVDLDLSYGLSLRSEVKEDTGSHTSAAIAQNAHLFSLGLNVNPISFENTALGIYCRFVGLIGTGAVQKGPYANPLFIEYVTFTPKIGVGVEPAYYFSKNFSIFFRTGFALSFIPATRYAELKSGSSDPSLKSSYEIKEQKDTGVAFGTDGLSLGLRFMF